MKLPGRVVLALFVVAQWFALTTGVARAQVDWCSGEPPVHLILPSGMPLEVNVRISVPSAHRAALHDASVRGEVVSMQGNTVTLRVMVTVPGDGQGEFPVIVSAASHGSSNSVNGNANESDDGSVVVPLTVTLPRGLS